MGSVLFVQQQLFAYAGMYYLCGALREAGHRYEVVVSNLYPTIRARIEAFAPDLVGFPCMTGMHKEILDLATRIKADFPGSRIILGGIHPTLFPEVLRHPAVDFICRGEGEGALCELVDALAAGATAFPIPNISYKAGGEVVANPIRPLVDPLDALPFPDYTIYGGNPLLAADTFPSVFMIRGCPFACSYCHNSNQRKVFHGLGRYVRAFSIERILAEVEAALAAYPKARAVFLGADTLGTDLPWLTELLTRYRDRFRLPYTCLIRPEYVTPELGRLLRETGCHMLAFGVESGSERVRRELLGRRYTNEAVERAARTLKEHRVRFRTYNIIGFPTETREEMLATLELNLRIGTDFPWCSIFTPYPETRLSAFALERGYLDAGFSYDDVPASFFNDTILKNVDRDFILNLHSLFQLMVLVPALAPLLKRLLPRRHNRLYRTVFKAVYSWVCIRSENRSLLSYLRLAYANRRYFR